MSSRFGCGTCTKCLRKLGADLQRTVFCYRRSFEQVLLVKDRIRGLQVRLERANRDNRLAMKYSLKRRLATLESVKEVYEKYSENKKAEYDILRARIEIRMVSVLAGFGIFVPYVSPSESNSDQEQ